MYIEYEATFLNVKPAEITERLKKAGASLIRPRCLQKRAVFHLPTGHEIPGSWARVRDEGDKVTMSIKIVAGDKITDQKESQITIDNFDEGVTFLGLLGCRKKAYQETYRELWTLDGVEITVDEWPFVEPFVEIEGATEAEVKRVSEQLGFEWKNAKFCEVSTVYAEKYHIDGKVLRDETPLLVFDMKNPFIK